MDKERLTNLAELAIELSKNSKCNRRHVGAVLIDGVEGEVIGQGWNSPPPLQENCEDAGCLIHEGSCKRTVHAEAHALRDAMLRLHTTSHGTVICTDRPCNECVKNLELHGISTVYFIRDYPNKYYQPSGILFVKVGEDLSESITTFQQEI